MLGIDPEPEGWELTLLCFEPQLRDRPDEPAYIVPSCEVWLSVDIAPSARGIGPHSKLETLEQAVIAAAT